MRAPGLVVAEFVVAGEGWEFVEAFAALRGGKRGRVRGSTAGALVAVTHR